MIQGRHLIFEPSTKNTFFHEMNNFVSHRQSQFRKVLAGWVVGKSLETDSFCKILEFLKGEVFIGKCCFAPGFEIYLISYLLPNTSESESRASFIMCLTNEYLNVSINKTCLGTKPKMHCPQMTLTEQLVRSNQSCLPLKAINHEQRERENEGNGSQNHHQNKLTFEPPSIALLYEQLSDNPSPK